MLDKTEGKFIHWELLIPFAKKEKEKDFLFKYKELYTDVKTNKAHIDELDELIHSSSYIYYDLVNKYYNNKECEDNINSFEQRENVVKPRLIVLYSFISLLVCYILVYFFNHLLYFQMLFQLAVAATLIAAFIWMFYIHSRIKNVYSWHNLSNKIPLTAFWVTSLTFAFFLPYTYLVLIGNSPLYDMNISFLVQLFCWLNLELNLMIVKLKSKRNKSSYQYNFSPTTNNNSPLQQTPNVTKTETSIPPHIKMQSKRENNQNHHFAYMSKNNKSSYQYNFSPAVNNNSHQDHFIPPHIQQKIIQEKALIKEEKSSDEIALDALNYLKAQISNPEFNAITEKVLTFFSSQGFKKSISQQPKSKIGFIVFRFVSSLINEKLSTQIDDTARIELLFSKQILDEELLILKHELKQ